MCLCARLVHDRLCTTGQNAWRLKVSTNISALTLKRILNGYPPYIGAGIRVASIASDFTHARMEMPLTGWNRNYVGTHFGGSLYGMCDPVYMLLLIQVLGPDSIVWDKAATIHYVQPGRGTVQADFVISPERITSFKSMAPYEKRVFDLEVQVKDAETGDVVAKITKTEYVKRKRIELPPPVSRL